MFTFCIQVCPTVKSNLWQGHVTWMTAERARHYATMVTFHICLEQLVLGGSGVKITLVTLISHDPFLATSWIWLDQFIVSNPRCWWNKTDRWQPYHCKDPLKTNALGALLPKRLNRGLNLFPGMGVCTAESISPLRHEAITCTLLNPNSMRN